MSEQLSVVIYGRPKSGTTSLAVAIRKALREAGVDVTLEYDRGDTDKQLAMLEEAGPVKDASVTIRTHRVNKTRTHSNGTGKAKATSTRKAKVNA